MTLLYAYIGTVIFSVLCDISVSLNIKAEISRIFKNDPDRVSRWKKGKGKRQYSTMAYALILLTPLLNIAVGLNEIFNYRTIFDAAIKQLDDDK